MLSEIRTVVDSRLSRLELDKVSEFNWLDDNFWLRKAYHEPRIPLLIHSNWWLALRPDPQPQLAEGHGTQVVASGITEHQLKVTAWLIRGFLDLKVRLDRYVSVHDEIHICPHLMSSEMRYSLHRVQTEKVDKHL